MMPALSKGGAAPRRNALTSRATAAWLRLRLNEVGPLVALLCLSGLGCGFLALAHAVGAGSTAGLDRAILLSLRDPADLAVPIGPRWLPETMRDITGLGSVFTVLFLTCAVAAYLAVTGRRRIGLFVIAAVGSGELVSTVLKILYQRPRPDLVPHGMEVFTASFPSGHATMSAVAYLTLATLVARIERDLRAKALVLALGVILTLLVGFSRIYLGVHWPSDVLAGWCVGSAWAALCWFIALQLQRHGEIEAPDPPPPA